ncbi:signal peptidase I [Actinophytocola sp.]|uniref:signal peptidase I n=1 Tax=Actinophytocola sp. TaxID=1872138 RepID=UPI002D8009A8|nr:signal peptidase I [Actinophytocola sp.]HET9138692.1 signal peptidase I [Actinophytocola sp.]
MVALTFVVLLGACGAADKDRFRVAGGSMEPGIEAGTTVVADPVTDGGYQGRRGDVVVFQRPNSWPAEGGDTLVKRVIAIGGETVACCDRLGRVTVDNVALDEPYLGDNAPLHAPAGTCRGRQFGPVAVAADHVFVLGDTRLLSVDSACHGPIPVSAVVGIVKQ